MQGARNRRIVGQYALHERLGIGGMAEVFAADCPRRGPVALKCILSGLAADNEFRAMFLDEARVTSRLNHPNVVQILDYGEDHGELYMALEFVDGPTVARLLRKAASRREPLSGPAIASLVVQLLDALHFVHHASGSDGQPLGIVHRDVSPGNVMLTSSGQVKLGDFGIVRSDVLVRRTRPGELKGKMGYMSPEQTTGAELDPRSDIFAVGIILAELLVLRPLFLGKNEMQTLSRSSQADLTTWHRFNGSVPLRLRSVVETALGLRPEDRFPSAASMRHELLAATESLGWSLGAGSIAQELERFELSSRAATQDKSGERRVLPKVLQGTEKEEAPTLSDLQSGSPEEDPTVVHGVTPSAQREVAAVAVGYHPSAPPKAPVGRPVWQVDFTSRDLARKLMLALRRAPSGLVTLRGSRQDDSPRETSLELREGRVVSVQDSSGFLPLGQMLVQSSILSEATLPEALAASRAASLRLGEYLVLSRRLRESTLIRLLKEQGVARLEAWFSALAQGEGPESSGDGTKREAKRRQLALREGTLSVAIAEDRKPGDELDCAPDSLAHVTAAMRRGLDTRELHGALAHVIDSVVLPSGIHIGVETLGLTAPETRALSTTLEGGVYEGRALRFVLDEVETERIARRDEARLALLVGLAAGIIQAPGF